MHRLLTVYVLFVSRYSSIKFVLFLFNSYPICNKYRYYIAMNVRELE